MSPPANMSALADLPDHFVDWVKTRAEFKDVPPAALREQFLPRRLYGDYLQELLAWARSQGESRKVRIDCVEAEVRDVVAGAERVQVLTSDGQAIEADRVVLATGHLPPAEPEGLDLAHPCCIRDPWQGWEDRLPRRGEAILLLGTGLTALDVFLTLDAIGWEGKVHAVSRNGLLPWPHFKGADYPDFKGEDLLGLSLDGMWSVLHRHCEKARRPGVEPRRAGGQDTPLHSAALARADPCGKAACPLARVPHPLEYSPPPAPEPVYRKVMEAIAGGRLEIVRGRARFLPSPAARVAIAVADGKGGERILEGGALFNCTGPQEGCTLAGSALYRNLLGRGLVAADDLGLGIRVAADFTAIERSGEALAALPGGRVDPQGDPVGERGRAGIAPAGIPRGGGACGGRDAGAPCRGWAPCARACRGRAPDALRDASADVWRGSPFSRVRGLP